MKKLLVAFALIIAMSFVGCSNVDVANDNSSEEQQTITQQAYKAKANEQIITRENLSEATETTVLSNEDKAVKAEIEKYVITNIDFRKNKQEHIGKRTYDLTFAEVNSSADFDIIYKNEYDDTFRYDINTGELSYVNIRSAIVEKCEESIDIVSAEKIAYDYISERCNINEYTLDLSEESEECFEFSYRRYICGYKTADVFAVNINFDGEIIYIINNTSVFENFDISQIKIDEKWINTKIAEIPNFEEYIDSIDYSSIIIMEKDEKIQLRFRLNDDNAIGFYYIPIEFS